MSLAKHQKAKRFPLLEPLYHETYLQAMWRQKTMVDHWRRVDYAKPEVDDGPPKAVINVRLKLKKLLVRGEELAKIERDNKFLLTNIVDVMKGEAKVDHYHKGPMQHRNTSLRVEEVNRQIQVINRENKTILGRIIKTRPTYDHVQMELDYQKTVKSRRGREYVYKMWNGQFLTRRKNIMSGKTESSKQYTDIDREALYSRMVETHSRCLPPSHPQHPPPRRPIPWKCRSPQGARPVSHRRCFTPPPSHPRYRTRWSKAAFKDEVPVRHTRSETLRVEANHRKLEALKRPPKQYRTRHKGKPRVPAKGQNVNQSAIIPLNSPRSPQVITPGRAYLSDLKVDKMASVLPPINHNATSRTLGGDTTLTTLEREKGERRKHKDITATKKDRERGDTVQRREKGGVIVRRSKDRTPRKEEGEKKEKLHLPPLPTPKASYRQCAMSVEETSLSAPCWNSTPRKGNSLNSVPPKEAAAFSQDSAHDRAGLYATWHKPRGQISKAAAERLAQTQMAYRSEFSLPHRKTCPQGRSSHNPALAGDNTDWSSEKLARQKAKTKILPVSATDTRWLDKRSGDYKSLTGSETGHNECSEDRVCTENSRQPRFLLCLEQTSAHVNPTKQYLRSNKADFAQPKKSFMNAILTANVDPVKPLSLPPIVPISTKPEMQHCEADCANFSPKSNMPNSKLCKLDIGEDQGRKPRPHPNSKTPQQAKMSTREKQGGHSEYTRLFMSTTLSSEKSQSELRAHNAHTSPLETLGDGPRSKQNKQATNGTENLSNPESSSGINSRLCKEDDSEIETMSNSELGSRHKPKKFKEAGSGTDNLSISEASFRLKPKQNTAENAKTKNWSYLKPEQHSRIAEHTSRGSVADQHGPTNTQSPTSAPNKQSHARDGLYNSVPDQKSSKNEKASKSKPGPRLPTTLALSGSLPNKQRPVKKDWLNSSPSNQQKKHVLNSSPSNQQKKHVLNSSPSNQQSHVARPKVVSGCTDPADREVLFVEDTQCELPSLTMPHSLLLQTMAADSGHFFDSLQLLREEDAGQFEDWTDDVLVSSCED